MGFERKSNSELGTERGAMSSIVKPRKHRRLAMRDFPKGCNSPVTIAVQGVETRMKIEVPGSDYDSDPEEKVMIQNHARLVSELPTGFVKMVIYPPRKSISAVRLFPRVCDRKNPHIDKQVQLKFNEADSDRTLPGVGYTLFGKIGDVGKKERKERKVATACDHIGSVIQLDGHKDKEQKNDVCRSLAGKLSGQYFKARSLQEKNSTKSEIPEHRTIVQALMAAPNCPWTQRKRATRSSHAAKRKASNS